MRLDTLLRPRSIAILGASERPSIGRALMESAAILGYDGWLYPINPKYTELMDQRVAARRASLAGACAVDMAAPLYAARAEVGQRFNEITQKDGLGAAVTWRAAQFAE